MPKQTKPFATTIHLRVPFTLKDQIKERAESERRPWTQMAVLMLQDAAEQWTAKQRKQTLRRA